MGDEKILFAPQPADQRLVRTPSAPASWMAWSTAPAPPAAWTPRDQSRRISSWSACIRSHDSSRASSSQLSGARQVGSAQVKATKWPSTDGSHARSSASSAKLGMARTPPSTGPSVPGLHASIIPFSDRTQGSTRSRWVIPRSHPIHVPYCSCRASIPQRS